MRLVKGGGGGAALQAKETACAKAWSLEKHCEANSSYSSSAGSMVRAGA